MKSEFFVLLTVNLLSGTKKSLLKKMDQNFVLLWNMLGEVICQVKSNHVETKEFLLKNKLYGNIFVRY